MKNQTKISKQNKQLLFVLFSGVLLATLDISIVAPAIPSIEQTIKLEHRLLSSIYSIYILFSVIGIQLFAKLSDVFGRRNIYMISVGIFAVGSAIVAISRDFNLILFGRAVQGMGVSGIIPVASAIVGDIFPFEKRGTALGVIAMASGLAFLIGPVLAETLLLYFKWNVLFLINLPIAALVISASYNLIPSKKIETISTFDWRGAALLAIIMTSFIIGIHQIDAKYFFDSILSLDVLPFLIFSLLLFFVFIYFELKAKFPLVNPRLFFPKQIKIAGIIAIGTGFLQALFIFIPKFALKLVDIEISYAGFMLLPVVIAIILGSPLTGKLIDKIGTKLVVLFGVLLTNTGFVLFNFIGNEILIFHFAGLLIGFGFSVLAGSALRYMLLNEVNENERASSQGVFTIFIRFRQIVGFTVIRAIIASYQGIEGIKTVFYIFAGFFILLFILAFFLKGRKKELTTFSN